MDKWMQGYRQIVREAFCDRVLFIGLQGSYGRNEAEAQSDIDVVLILDAVSLQDLLKYREITQLLPHRELLCGFVSGIKEITNWSKADLFQFYFDTISIEGSLDDIISAPSMEDAKQAVLTGACNIYHGCSHNFLHAADIGVLQSLYKSAFFVMQAAYYCETGVYIGSKKDMQKHAENQDPLLLQGILTPGLMNKDYLEEYSQALLDWTSKLIVRYGAK